MKLDKATLLGPIVAVGGICYGLILEGGSIVEILQPTAAFIVFGGTLGATLLSQPGDVIAAAFRRLREVFSENRTDPEEVVEQVVDLAMQARRGGILSLEKHVQNLTDPFMKKALTLAIDGAEPDDIRQIMELEIEQENSRRESEAQVLEAAGGFAPTIGIIGAVLGLIQVMKHLDNIDEVGKGIAVAFVATIYGVGAANLFLLPGAKKMMALARRAETHKQLALEGVISLADGLNPRLIRSKLDAFLTPDSEAEPEGGRPAARSPARAAESP